MPVIRVNKTRDYTVMSNTHLRDKRLSLKAKGLLSLMLSLSEEWNYSIAGLVAISKENESAIKSTLNELKEFGYLMVTKKMPNETESGRIEYEYDIYESPHQKQDAGKQDTEKQGIENLQVESLSVENQGQYNTKESNTKELNNKEINNIVEFLNEKAGTRYRAGGSSTKKHISARIAEGLTIDDFKAVIEKKCAEWKGTDMEKYLRPETLFGTKFESYLNAPAAKPKNNGTQVINGKEYEYINGKYYVKGGSGIAVNPFATDELPF